MGKGRPRGVSWFLALCGCLHGTIEGTVPLSLASDNKNPLYEEDCGQFIQPRLTPAPRSLSLRFSGLFPHTPPPPPPGSLFLASVHLTLIISASLERTRAAPRGHVHCAVSSACLVLAHSPGAPILVLSSLARKCAGVWTLFSPWYLTSGLPRALPSLPSRGLCFPALPPAPAHGSAFQEAEAPPTSP